MSPEENERANVLCVISLVCEVIPLFMNGIVASLMTVADDWENSGFSTVLYGVTSSLSGILFIAGIVLLIIVRVKYPKNVFGKVLMWVYIVIGVIMLLLLIAAVVLLIAACNACVNGLSNCPGLIF